MKLYEFQGKGLFARYHIPTPKGKMAENVNQALDIIKNSKLPVVVKAQVLTGGRGKAGGVKLVRSLDEANEVVNSIFGLDIKGYKVKKVLIEEGLEIKKEIYLSFLMNRNSEKITLITSGEGGMEIETVAKEKPEAILKVDIDPLLGIKSYHITSVFDHLHISDRELQKQFTDIIKKMYKMVTELYLNLVEINPLVIIKGNRILALDSKVIIDDNGVGFIKDFDAFKNYDDLTPEEITAKENGLSFVKLNGNIGCIVNGAGLAMATMDMIKHFGGEPANFLDVGGSSNPEKVINAIKIIRKDKNVKVILFNIFGGITRCDDIANGIKKAVEILDIKLPLVIRLTGTNEKEGVDILRSLGLETTTSMQKAVKKAVSLIGE
ncbi:ADP-forming succinate--CoA ligase subunit beta [candidate division TA06 bacterium]|uniref:Succinate--CoA ligase [ADP-forming] subunit beta n=1 Tax=candidate division TA06 bacterium TaxID=2250710 RepID=A0A660S9I4_UNCT6|nr:MAG: ADP-forming succinate--CoA ligase subunit beta [candidate division TA06 bacterium]